MASGECRRQWHKYLPLTVLNYNTIYYSSVGCEPSIVLTDEWTKQRKIKHNHTQNTKILMTEQPKQPAERNRFFCNLNHLIKDQKLRSGVTDGLRQISLKLCYLMTIMKIGFRKLIKRKHYIESDSVNFPNYALEEVKLQPDDDITIAGKDLSTISCEADFDNEFFESRRDDASNGTAPGATNSLT